MKLFQTFVLLSGLFVAQTSEAKWQLTYADKNLRFRNLGKTAAVEAVEIESLKSGNTWTVIFSENWDYSNQLEQHLKQWASQKQNRNLAVIFEFHGGDEGAQGEKTLIELLRNAGYAPGFPDIEVRPLQNANMLALVFDNADSRFAMPEPRYLEIPGFKDCLKTMDQCGMKFYCMPREKPISCEEDSWTQLNELQGNDRLQDC